MRFAGILGLVALAGSVAPALPGQQVASASVAGSASCTGPFARVPSPSPGSSDNILFATAASGTHDVWAVGRQSDGAGIYQNLILFDGGSGWSQIASPDPGPSFSALAAVSASGPSDAWAAGSYDTGNPADPIAPEALHWDGSSWTSEPLPALPGEFNADEGPGIVDISPTDAWLVGGWFGASTSGSFIAHWDGTAWSLVSHPGVAGLNAVAADGPDGVWAVGTGAGPSFPAVIEHYDGSTWTKSATLSGVSLSGVTSIGPARAWAVGGTSGGATATVEWNGSAWKVVPSPNPSTAGGLDAVSGVAGGGVWAVGTEVDFSTGIGESQPMAMHWDGTAWTAAPAIGTAPDTFGSTGTFLGVVAVTASRVVVVGFGSSQADSLVAHLCAFAVRDTGFDPSSAKVSGPGAAAYWVLPASDTSDHELADGSGFGLFNSGSKAPGSAYAFTFPASGTFLVTDRSDGAHEKVSVPILAIRGAHGRPGLWWASAAPPAGARFEIQDIPPGGTKFVHFKTTTKLAQGLSRQLPAGTYKFRSRLRNPTSGATTGWSPTLTVTVP